MASNHSSAELEKGPQVGAANSSSSLDNANRTAFYNDGAVPGESFAYGDSTYAKLQRWAGKFNIEQRGIERVPENERTESGMRANLNVATMWFSANLVVSAFAIGILANETFFLGFTDAMLACFFFNLLAIIPVCFFSTFGPKFGLRQMVLSRFWFGYRGTYLIAFFNLLACLGWSSVNSIVGAQLINAVNTDVPGEVGIVIVALCTLGITLFGYKVVHIYEFWSWIPTLIVFLIVLGVFAHSGDFVNVPMGVGYSELGDVLSFGATVFGFGIGWASYASDYTVYQDVNTSRKSVFIWNYGGLLIALLFCEMLGIAIMTASTANLDKNPYYDLFETSGTGGLLAAALAPVGKFADFCLVILALSIIANNCPNIYSFSLTIQVFGPWTQRVPRFVWIIVCTVLSIAIAIPGYSHFFDYLDDFMDFIGYWLSIYSSIAITDHLVFKRGLPGYIPEHYDQPDKLPPGFAAIGAFLVGIIGMMMGMSQVFFVGPIALTAGEAPYGGDVGCELCFAFSAVSYLLFRTVEKRLMGR